MKLVYIKWCDAIGKWESWNTKDEAHEWAEKDYWEVEQVGWVMKETKKYLLLCSKVGLAQGEEPMYGQLLKLPKTWILKRVNLSDLLEDSANEK